MQACRDLKKENKIRVDEGEKSKSSTHCHCPQWSPSEELIAEVFHCKPYQRKIEQKSKNKEAAKPRKEKEADPAAEKKGRKLRRLKKLLPRGESCHSSCKSVLKLVCFEI